MTESKKAGKDKESIQSSATQDTTLEYAKTQLNITNESQEVSPLPAGDHRQQ